MKKGKYTCKKDVRFYNKLAPKLAGFNKIELSHTTFHSRCSWHVSVFYPCGDLGTPNTSCSAPTIP